MAVTDEVELIEMSREEWDTAVAAALAELGMTYEELAEEARTGEYRSTDARLLWVIIGGSGGTVTRDSL